MDRFQSNLTSISKKPPGKQIGLAEAQQKANFARDAYQFLKSEIVEDIHKIHKEINVIVLPIMSTILVSYTEYINNINNVWGEIPPIISDLPQGGFDSTPVYTANELSMISEINVQNRIREEMNGGTYDDPDSTRSYNTSQPNSARGLSSETW